MDKLVLYVLAGLGLLFAVPLVLGTILYLGVRLLIVLFPFILLGIAFCALYAIGRLFCIGKSKRKDSVYIYRD